MQVMPCLSQLVRRKTDLCFTNKETKERNAMKQKILVCYGIAMVDNYFPVGRFPCDPT
jgi:hypothetical protein